MIFGREPVAILAAVNALVALAVGFGLDLTSEQQALVHGAVSALLALIARQAVTPNVTVDEGLDMAHRLAALPNDPEPTTGAPS